jgi:hypothetical protein
MPETKDAFLEYATEGGGQFGERLRFVKGDWLYGADKAPDGRYLAGVDQLARGWTRREKNKPVEYRIVFVGNGKKPATREELGHTDALSWEQDGNGDPKDPWQLQSFLPLTHIESGENFVWVFDSKGAEKAARKLALAYAKRGCGPLPIVVLEVGGYEHERYGWQDTPVLKVVDWQDKDGLAPTIAPVPAPKLPQREDPIASGLPAKAKAIADNADLDDDIVF